MTCVIVGRQRPVIVSDNHDWISAQFVSVKPGVPHRVTVPDGGAEIVYLDGVQMAAGRSAFTKLPPEWRALPDAFDAKDHAALSAFRDLLNADNSPPDPDIMKIVHELYADPFTRMSQSDLADALGLERTQALRHFKATTGQTFRRFKIWAAIVAATRSAHQGAQIGLVGIETGFADAAHLARTASSVFGVTPTAGLSGLAGIVTLPSIPPLPLSE
ncbi:AraC family transcriptional regulator [Roseobacter fucihabitans]